ncbi:MAG: Cyclic di-GMP phosphodiesterase response regulator RpfG [Deltaproteobacteria bacterium ADurb.Bin510]|nr:MAG: Cyclic di-GMP phosphodiesterase response regulator RpfG [Deltaproteobacteria bacterium ADurb.Bin510]
MQAYRSVPPGIFRPDEKLGFPVFIERDQRLVTLVRKGACFPDRASLNLEQEPVIYVRERDLEQAYRHAGRHLDAILADASIPASLKATIFYTSAAQTMQAIFDDPRAELIGRMQASVRSLVRSISANQKILEELFRITAHDYCTYTHSLNVGIFATALALKYFGASPGSLDDLERFCYGFFLHDIGKSLVPREIINKPEELSAEEWSLMRKHPEHGYAILMGSAQLTDEAAYITLEHHEKFGGGGYPYGRKGNQIHPCARICAIADSFDALTTVRAYKPALSPYEALRIMQQEMLHEFDYDFLQVFIRLLGPA